MNKHLLLSVVVTVAFWTLGKSGASPETEPDWFAWLWDYAEATSGSDPNVRDSGVSDLPDMEMSDSFSEDSESGSQVPESTGQARESDETFESSDPWKVEYVELNTMAPITTISRGQKVDLEPYLSAKGRTIVEFTAQWSEKGRELSAQLRALVNSRNGYTLRRIYVRTRSSPAAKQYKIRNIPHLMLFENGKLVAEGTRQVLALIR